MAFPRACEEAAHRGAVFLEKKLADGSLSTSLGLGPCYKMPYAFGMTGRHCAGNRMLDEVVAAFSTAPGVFTPEPAPGDPASWGLLMRQYKAAVVLIGAAQLGRWDVCSPEALDHLKTQMIPIAEDAAGIGCRDEYLAVTASSMVGLLMCHRGELEAVTRLANFLVRVYELQPRHGTHFFRVYDTARKCLVTEAAVEGGGEGGPPPVAALAWLKGRKVLYSVDASKERQHNYAPGIAAAFLSEAYVCTRDRRYLATARALIQFDRVCSWAGAFRRWPSKCKAAWGAANLARALAVAAAGGGCDSPLRLARMRRSDSSEEFAAGGRDEGPPAKKAKTESQDTARSISHDSNSRHDFGDGDPTPAREAHGAVAAHCRAVAEHCFLANQAADGGFGPYHFPLKDESVDNLPAGTCHWTSQPPPSAASLAEGPRHFGAVGGGGGGAAPVAPQHRLPAPAAPPRSGDGGGVPADSFAFGTELELTAEFVYELVIVAKGLLSAPIAPAT